MSDIKKNSESKNSSNGNFRISFNQDYTSLSVANECGYKLFAINSVNKIDEIFNSESNVDTKIAERLFGSSLVSIVISREQYKLKIVHYKKRTDICEFKYPKNILSVKMNRSRLVVGLKDSVYIHNIRDMRLLHAIKQLPDNPTGLITLSLNSHLAYPCSKDCGNIQIYDAGNLQHRIIIEAHSSPVAAMNFSSTGTLLATASQKGTVIRVFCTKNGQRVMEFRRGVKRYAQIMSLNFSICGSFLSVSSNTETIHIFKIDQKAKEAAEKRQDKQALTESGDEEDKSDERSGIMKAFSKAMETLIPVSTMLYQDRAFAHVQLSEPGLRHTCVVAKLEKELRLMVACEDGFLYIYNLDANGGECKLLKCHDLRGSLYDITELNGNETSSESLSTSAPETIVVDSPSNTPAFETSFAEVMKGKSVVNPIDPVNTYQSKNAQIFDETNFPPMCQA
ncbi:WD repeat domain phosphoinositide-interacting protein 1-like isoform X1 [Chironomus tepperi]|uniref:WD repeat domain phosphoinositide-interacting protein 1-like isoform X1 n=1 Tax=Chironomus tepperi TaxID=113505 RepID=UPI00391F7AB6